MDHSCILYPSKATFPTVLGARIALGSVRLPQSPQNPEVCHHETCRPSHAALLRVRDLHIPQILEGIVEVCCPRSERVVQIGVLRFGGWNRLAGKQNRKTNIRGSHQACSPARIAYLEPVWNLVSKCPAAFLRSKAMPRFHEKNGTCAPDWKPCSWKLAACCAVPCWEWNPKSCNWPQQSHPVHLG